MARQRRVVPEPPSKAATLRLGLMKRDKPPPPVLAAGAASLASQAAGSAEAEGSSSDDVEPPRALDRALPVEPERDADG